MNYAVCFCPRSFEKLGMPSVEAHPETHPKCPECGADRRAYTLNGLVQMLIGYGQDIERWKKRKL